MQWNVDILALPAADPDNFLIAAIYDASAPGVVVDFIPLVKPYTGASQQITFLNVDPIVYNFKLWENATPDVGGIIRNTFSFQPTTSTIQTRADIDLTTDNTVDDPVSGTTQYSNPSLEGWTYEVERVGQGTMFKNVNYEVDEDSETPLFGFHLIQPGDVFNPEEKFVIRFYNKVGTTSISAVVNAAFSGARVITTDDAIVPADAGKAILIEAASTQIAIDLPALADVSDFKMFNIFSTGGNHFNAVFNAVGSDEIDFDLADTQQIILGRRETLKLYKFDGMWRVDSVSSGVLDVGKIDFDYDIGKVNTVVANGQLLQRADFPRLWAKVQTLSAQLVTEANWNNTAVDLTTDAIVRNVNHGKYSSGDGSTTFRVPKLTEYGYVRAVDGASRLAGSLQSHQIGAFDLNLNGPIMTKAGNMNQVVVVGNINDGDLGTRNVDMGIINTGKENFPTNVGLYALIRI